MKHIHSYRILAHSAYGIAELYHGSDSETAGKVFNYARSNYDDGLLLELYRDGVYLRSSFGKGRKEFDPSDAFRDTMIVDGAGIRYVNGKRAYYLFT